MKIVSSLREWRNLRADLPTQQIGFVPTMGNLHAGHMSLCQRAKRENQICVVSIFVNPTQFNQEEDFEHYPRTLTADEALLNAYQIDYLLLPQASEIYADQYQFQLSETQLSTILEGKFRPGHFTGMLTIVLKLLHLVAPTRTYVGEKDYQQFLLIDAMVKALFINTKIIPCETIRSEDGLALSSRNARLSPEERMLATHFPKLLHSKASTDEITAKLTHLGFKVDYIAEQWGRLLGAVWLNQTRLIDNVLR